MSTRTLAHHYRRLLTLWPTDDALRRISFKSVLSARLAKYDAPAASPNTPATPTSATSQTPPPPPSTQTTPSAGSSTAHAHASASSNSAEYGAPGANANIGKTNGALGLDSKAELINVNALYSLLENRYTKRYPLSNAYLQPQSNPSYYDDLLRELEEAPNRSWFGRVAKKMTGMFRLR